MFQHYSGGCQDNQAKTGFTANLSPDKSAMSTPKYTAQNI